MKPFVKAVAVLLVALALAGCASSSGPRPVITKEEFAQLKVGMTYQQATEIIGDDGERKGGAKDELGNQSDGYSWMNQDKSFAVARFENGKLTDKSASNLP